ncbi:MAG: glycosyltransferase family 4 protein [Pseudomonadota bacterium]
MRDKKILILITEDWFAVSHFLPLIETLVENGADVVVATRLSGKSEALEAVGATVVPFDFRRSSLNPFEQAFTVRRLSKLIQTQRPDVVHVIAMQPMVLAALAARFTSRVPMMMHLTGLGFLGISEGRAAKFIRPAAMAALNGVLARKSSWLIAENPEDHGFLVQQGIRVGDRVTIVPGAGVDEARFSPCTVRMEPPTTAAFVGRMIQSKGVEVLVEASRIIRERANAGAKSDASSRSNSNLSSFAVSLYGRVDDDNPEAIPETRIRQWEEEGLVTWHGHVADVADIWRRSDICVLPSTSREGMPRAVLEAAASRRPIIVTDVPGSRHFVRDGVEGLIVPPDDAVALADALSELASQPDKREAMGEAAHARLIGGFTEAHVKRGLLDAYAGLGFDSRHSEPKKTDRLNQSVTPPPT